MSKMKKTNSRIYTARLHLIWGLALLMVACKEKREEKEKVVESKVGIQWTGHRATALMISQKELHDFLNDSVSQWLNVQLGYSTQNILGEYSTRNDSVVFTPLIPFTSGFEYSVKWKGHLLEHFRIPVDTTLEPPKIIAIYPSADSLPANLLKMYIIFNKPMVEGQAMEYIEVTKNKKTVVPGAILDLEPELWNKDRTMLTVWFDPGRIKRDLQPNKKLGAPLEPGNRYIVSVHGGWEDEDGQVLGASLRLDFIATARDEQSPDPAKWFIAAPPARSQVPLAIDMFEPMDYAVLQSAVRLLDFAGKPVEAEMTFEHGETVMLFKPAREWKSGYYSLEIEPRLEDVAGNNLERLFDRDILQDSGHKKITTKRVFAIK